MFAFDFPFKTIIGWKSIVRLANQLDQHPKLDGVNGAPRGLCTAEVRLMDNTQPISKSNSLLINQIIQTC